MKRLPRDQEKKLADDAHLLRAWRKWHAEQLEEALAGAHGAMSPSSMTLLDQLELNSAATLLDFMQRTDWSSVSYDVRLTALHQINESICRLRERHGLPPIDDPLPGQPDNAFSAHQSRAVSQFAGESRLLNSWPRIVPTATHSGLSKMRMRKMSSDIVKRQTMEIDSIDDFDDTIIGGDGGRGASGVSAGRRADQVHSHRALGEPRRARTSPTNRSSSRHRPYRGALGERRQAGRPAAHSRPRRAVSRH